MIVIAAVHNSREGAIPGFSCADRHGRQPALSGFEGDDIVTTEGIVMSRIDDTASVPARAERERSLLSRRSVVQGAASAGAAGVAGAALLHDRVAARPQPTR